MIDRTEAIRLAQQEIEAGLMTQRKWDALPQAVKDAARDTSGLTPVLRGLEGYRVEVVDAGDETETLRRFIVGRSSGWKPCHIELKRRNSLGGFPAARHYASLRVLDKVHAATHL